MSVARRVAAVRMLQDLTQQDFAALFNLTQDQLSNIESGRTALKWQLGLSICRSFNLSQLWLGLGLEPMHPFFELGNDQDWFPGSESISFPDFVQDLRPKLELHRALLPDRVSVVSDAQVQAEFLKAVEATARSVSIHVSPEKRLEFLSRLSSHVHKLLFDLEIFQKAGLTKVTDSGKPHPVKSELTLKSLLARLNTATKEPGKKSQLAKHMRVPLSNVSQWLSGKREPGGETTLKLLKWVEEQERSNQK
jgi:transcriptional regulator with XRE-family HTH domain